ELFARHDFYRDVEFDASFLAPWAVRLRRRREPIPRIIAPYKRRLWELLKENQACREVILEQRNELLQVDGKIATAVHVATEPLRRVDVLRAGLREVGASVELGPAAAGPQAAAGRAGPGGVGSGGADSERASVDLVLLEDSGPADVPG